MLAGGEAGTDFLRDEIGKFFEVVRQHQIGFGFGQAGVLGHRLGVVFLDFSDVSCRQDYEESFENIAKTINEYAIVVASSKISNVPKGSIGTVVHVYENKDAYEVEFIVDNSSIVETVTGNQIDEKQ